MIKTRQRKMMAFTRLAVMVVLLGLISVMITWAQPPPPRNDDLMRDANDVIDQVSAALTQTLFGWNKVNLGDIEAARAHIHEAINIIAGENGENFDPQFGRPSGPGAIPSATQLLNGIEEIQGMPGSDDYVIAGDNIIQFLSLSVDRALIALNELERDAERASEELRLMQGMLMAARGSVEEKDRPTEGGARSVKAWLEDLSP